MLNCLRLIFRYIEQVIVHGTLLPIMDMEEVLVLMFSKYAMEEEVMVCRSRVCVLVSGDE